jgi:hypothetical protein
VAIVDEQGRLFGRWNLIDALVVLVVLALIPLAYGAYALFRTPPPRLIAIEPPKLLHGPNLQITIRGEHLRPYMRVTIDDKQARNFLFHSDTTAVVELGDVSPGTFDVVLYDYAQERARLAKALTILPPPLPSAHLDVVGAFRNLPTTAIAPFKEGLALGEIGVIRKVGQPLSSIIRAISGSGTVEIPFPDTVDLPLVIRVGCYLKDTGGKVQCVGGGVALEKNAVVMLPTPVGQLVFQIDQLLSPVDVVDVEARVRVAGEADVLSLMKAGDVDVSVARNPLAAGARVLAVGDLRNNGPTSTREATLRVPVQAGVSGWRYAGDDFRTGSGISFTTLGYTVDGVVLRVTPGAPQTPQTTQN